MRFAACFVLGSSIVVACGGEVTPSPSGNTTEPQTTNDNSADPSSSANSSTSGSVPATAEDASTGSGACWLNYATPAPGECTVGDTRTCPAGVDAGPSSVGEGPEGFCEQMCVNLTGTATWSEPTSDAECAYYDTNLYIGANNPACLCNTPLVLSFDGKGVMFTSDATGSFDLTRLGVSHGSDWPSAATPWLALDRDGNGAIDDGGELFGSATRLASGAFAKNGFEALRDLDANHDGVFDAADPAFARVVVWADRNNDKMSQPAELTSLAANGVTAISLRDKNEPRCDARGNCEGERASFTLAGGARGTVIDVYLPTR